MTLNTMIMQRFFISLIPNIFITYLQEDEVREGLGYAWCRHETGYFF